ncbi:MAG: hypothetical protein ABR501_12990 [Pyrinomonadaceae bacterium]
MTAGWRWRALLMCGAAIVVFLTADVAAYAQCAMCKAALGGSNNAFFIRNFNIGVLVLLVPPVTIFCSIFVVLKRYKAAEHDETKDRICSSPEGD